MTFLLLCSGFVVTAYASTVLLYTAFGRTPAGHFERSLPSEYEDALRELDAEFPAARALPGVPATAPARGVWHDLTKDRSFVRHASPETVRQLTELTRSLPSEGGAPVRLDTLETLVDGEWVRNEVLRFGR